ncbi:restriction endonuclease subunit S, partial [Anaerococcus vaginalis]
MRNVPELRFDGFDGEWEEHNLSEFISIYRGLTYSPKDITNNRSDTFVIRSSNVKNNSIIDADNVYVNPSIVNTENVKNGDIILVVRNGSRSLIGKHAAITKDMPNTVIGAFMSGVRARTPDFINALFDTTKFDKNIRKNLGATINQITNKNISEMKFFFTD